MATIVAIGKTPEGEGQSENKMNDEGPRKLNTLCLPIEAITGGQEGQAPAVGDEVQFSGTGKVSYVEGNGDEIYIDVETVGDYPVNTESKEEEDKEKSEEQSPEEMSDEELKRAMYMEAKSGERGHYGQ